MWKNLRGNFQQDNFQRGNFQRDNFQKDNFQHEAKDYSLYEKKCLEIFNYFEGLQVMEKLCDESNIRIDFENTGILRYNITLQYGKNWLVLKNYSQGKYSEREKINYGEFSCIFLLDVSWGNHFTIFKDYYILDRVNNRPISSFKEYYRDNLNFDFLEITEFEVIKSWATMNDELRIKCNIKNVDLDKILELVNFMEEDSRRRNYET